ncbi:subtilisin-like serine protease [Ceratobasidium sp. 394]|nr:subtilisin-like serine protease [Ceratobasidium sp. 394]
MLAFVSIAALCALAPVFAAPTSVPITKHAGSVKASSYIVKLKDGVSKDAHLNSISVSFVAGSSLEYKFGDVFHGYAINIKGKDLDFLRQSKDIDFIEEDGIVTLDYTPGDELEAMKRSESEAAPPNAPADDDNGVDIYGIDTGIYTAHECFGGRARWGATFGGYADADGNGHGTHTAGTAVGNGYGQANRTRIIAVKVLSDGGSGSYSGIIAGVNYAYESFKASARPSIATMSLGGSGSIALDSAVGNAINGGLHFTVSAGNSNDNAAYYSPARVAAANTVGAVDSNNKKARFSNYGPIIDIQALGVSVRSAWIGSPNASYTASGTSMATPFVAGILAVAIGEYGNMSPANLTAELKSHARAIVSDVPSGTTNLLATLW